MTGTQHDVPQRRMADHGWCGAVAAWWRTFGQLVMGVWLLAVSLVVLIIALQVRSFQVDRQHQAAATATAARVACERSRVFGPTLLDDYERRHVFPPGVIDRYRASIPKTCPTRPK